jgi:membrane-associated phospholipid phosphatase
MTAELKYYIKQVVLLYLLWAVAFQIVGRCAATLPTYDLTMAIDRSIPVIPAFIWPYELCYAFPLLPIVLVRDWHVFNRGALAMVLMNVSAFAVYLFLPIAYSLPDLGDSLSERVLAFEYAADFRPGANKLPSMHVAFSWLVYFMCRGQTSSRRVDHATFATALLITISTVLVKQHLVIDMVGGVIWAVAGWAVAGRLYPRISGSTSSAPVALRRVFAKVWLPATVVSVGLLLLRFGWFRLFQS